MGLVYVYLSPVCFSMFLRITLRCLNACARVYEEEKCHCESCYWGCEFLSSCQSTTRTVTLQVYREAWLKEGDREVVKKLTRPYRLFCPWILAGIVKVVLHIGCSICERCREVWRWGGAIALAGAVTGMFSGCAGVSFMVAIHCNIFCDDVLNVLSPPQRYDIWNMVT